MGNVDIACKGPVACLARTMLAQPAGKGTAITV
jgi:hypothetical protein